MIFRSKRKERQWIPVSEKLPDEDDEVLVAWTDEEIPKHKHWYDIGYVSGGKWYIDGWEIDVNVLAWMPLPERYEGEAE